MTDPRDLWLVLSAGLLYVLGVVFRDYWYVALGVSPQVSADYLAHRGVVHQLPALLIRLPAVAVLLLALWLRPEGSLRVAIGIMNRRAVAWAVVATLATSVLLNAMTVWPYTWRWHGNTSGLYLAALLRGAQWLAVLMWAIVAIIVNPFVEEVVFRFGVLRLLANRTKSASVAVVGSSILFAIGHLGYWPIWRPDVQHVVNATWLLAASAVLGVTTVRQGGNIAVSITAHATRNGLEFASLLVTLGWLSGGEVS